MFFLERSTSIFFMSLQLLRHSVDSYRLLRNNTKRLSDRESKRRHVDNYTMCCSVETVLDALHLFKDNRWVRSERMAQHWRCNKCAIIVHFHFSSVLSHCLSWTFIECCMWAIRCISHGPMRYCSVRCGYMCACAIAYVLTKMWYFISNWY